MHDLKHATSRRRFLQVSAAGVTAGLLPRARLHAASANGKLQHACIGIGGIGNYDREQLAKHPQLEVVAICDVDRRNLAEAARKHPAARTYADWRELLATEGDRIDSINVSVPDHMHAAITMTALRTGKHVYCQKPLCHNVAEVRAVTHAAKESGVVTQLGTQVASGIGDRMAVQLLKQGVIGKAKKVFLCSSGPGTAGHRLTGPRPAQGETPPGYLDWDLWIGAAPLRPYAPAIYHPKAWRAWQDFGTGWSGDMGCHIFDPVWKGLGLAAPKTVVARVQQSWKDDPQRRADTWPQSDHIIWIFPGNEMTEGDELVLEWHDGSNLYTPQGVRQIIERDDFPAEGSLVVGTEGALLLELGNEPELLPSKKFKDHPRPELPPRDHYHHYIDACLGGERTESHFAQTGPMTETILLGTVAIRTPDVTLQWNSAQMKISNYPDAENYLRRTYRTGWQVEGL